MITEIRLDHVAVAVERHADAWPRYAGDLAGRWRSGGWGAGFAPAQLDFRGGRLEVLAPHRTDDDDFLRRFLDRNGPGPHHLTFKVDDINEALSEAAIAGYTPINVDLSDPTWREAFLHPKDAPGVLIQLAQSGGEWNTPPPAGLPPPRTPGPATLVHIAHAVASLDEGRRLFSGLLGGEQVGEGGTAHHRWLDLSWPTDRRVRLVSPSSEGSPLWSWLAGRAGRLQHLGFACQDPGAVPDARRLGSSTWSVRAPDNLGTGLVLVPPEGDEFDEGPLA